MKLLLVGITENISVRGVERYTYELVKALSKNENITITLLCGAWQSYYFPLEQSNVRVKKIALINSKACRHLWHLFVMPSLFRGFDVVHLNNTLPILCTMGKPVVVTIHDLAEYFVPEKYGFTQLYYRRFVSFLVSKVATHIVTVSEYSKKTISCQLGVSTKKITSIYLGVDHFLHKNIKTKLSGDECSNKPQKGYLLYWGVLEKSKGVLEAILGFKLFKELNPGSDLTLILVGKMGNAESDVVKYFDEDGVSYLGFVCDDDLISLCQNAQAIIFPSKYEGFGLPPLEGFLYCDNIIASRTTSVGEITKRFAFQVDPSDVSDIANTISLVVDRPKKYKATEKNIILNEFTWERCAEATLHVYQQETLIKGNS